MKPDFGDYVKHKAAEEGLSIVLVQDWMGWSYAKARGIIIGAVHPERISFTEAVALAGILGVSVEELANAAGINS